MLLRANPDTVNKKGFSPLAEAKNQECTALIQLLEPR